MPSKTKHTECVHCFEILAIRCYCIIVPSEICFRHLACLSDVNFIMLAVVLLPCTLLFLSLCLTSLHRLNPFGVWLFGKRKGLRNDETQGGRKLNLIARSGVNAPICIAATPLGDSDSDSDRHECQPVM